MSDEKPLDPTPARLARARREGSVPRSTELVGASAFGAAAIVACAVLSPLQALSGDALRAAARGVVPRKDLALVIALALFPVAAATAFAVLAGVAQTGGIRVTAPGLTLARLDPSEGLRRMASRETPAHALRAVAAFCAAAIGIVPAVVHAVLVAANAGSVSAIVSVSWSATQRTLFVACAVGALFASAEYALARGSWRRKLRMSFDDLRREIKEQEGDPHARGRRKSRHRELARSSVARVREAAFVVANPTHVAIALAYRPPETPVPLVLVRAADAVAQRVRAEALRLRIPIVEEPELARALYAGARAGSTIPVEHYVAVAEIVVALTNAGAIAR